MQWRGNDTSPSWVAPNSESEVIIMAKSKSNNPIKPGQTAPASGQYGVVGPNGGQHGEVTAVKGKTMPPTPKPGQTYVLVDPTKNDSGKSK